MYGIIEYILLTFILILQINSFNIEVKVKQGTVIGTRGITVFDGRLYYVFYGVPYARAPVGKFRFKDPEPMKKWKYPLDTRTEHHGACAQAHIVHKHALFGTEDCLHMNIYTPHISRTESEYLRAVIVWIHGYSFTSSFSHIYGADFLIDNDVLFVSVTHRIGVFGFLELNNDTNVNMGLKDIIMALKWIRKNIKHFGGDKNRITVMGSGSAGTFLSLLLMTKYKRLFSKMILQSGVIFSPSVFQGDPKLEIVKLRNKLKQINEKDIFKASAKSIISASQKLYSNREIINLQRPLTPFSPIIEKKHNTSLITKHPEEVFKKGDDIWSPIPLLVGFNSQEGISEAIPFLRNPKYLSSFFNIFKFMVPFSDGCKFNYTTSIYKYVSEKIKAEYFKGVISENSLMDFLRYTSDLRQYPIYKFIKTYLKITRNKIFVYKFDYEGKFNAFKSTSMAGVNVKVKGASHGDEICYILKCEPLWESYVKIRNDTSNRERTFIKSMAEMWANFAKTGHPTPSHYGNINWSPMTMADDNVLLIRNIKKLIHSKAEEKMYRFWNEIYDDYYSNNHCNKIVHDEL